MANISTIAVDARTLTFQETGERGIGTYTVEHLSAWAKLCPQVSFRLLTEKGAEFVRGQKLFDLPNITRGHYTLAQSEFIGADLFHVPDTMSLIEGFDSPFRLAPSGVRSSCVFYDLIPLALRETSYDKWHKNIQRAYDMRLQHLVDSGAKVLAISENTRRDLVNLAGISDERIAVIMAGLTKHPTFNPSPEQIAQTKNSLGIDKPFLLVVGGLDEHKGFLYTLEASLELLKSDQMQLVVVGSMIDPWKVQLKELLKKREVNGVIFTGFISDHDLTCLYANAIALVFPSDYEGFGFPVLEAMAHGCPVICSNRASLPEVGGDAVIYLQDVMAQSIFGAIRFLISDPLKVEEFKEKGIQRAGIFSWPKVAAKTMEAINCQTAV